MGIRETIGRVRSALSAGREAWRYPNEPTEYDRARVEPIYRMGTFRQGIVSTEQQPTPGQLVVDGFRGTQATAARAIASRLSSIPLIVQQELRQGSGTTKWETIDDHPLLPVLRRPNPLLSRRQMIKLTSYWLTQSGEAFWLIVTNGVGATRALWPMSPRHIEKLSGTDSPVSGFVFHGEAGEVRYGLEEVVWMFDPDPADPFQGVGIVGPQAVTYDASTFAGQTMRKHYQDDATPKVILKAGEGALAPDEEQQRRFAATWKNRFNRRGGEFAGVPAFIPTDYDAQVLDAQGQVADSKEYEEFLRDSLFMANGVPRSIVGDVVDANRAAADTNRLVFDRHTIEPQAGIIADALTNQLSSVEFGDSIRVRFEDFIDEDEDLRLREEEQDIRLGVRSINHVREERGLDPVEWGDYPWGSMADSQIWGPDREDPSDFMGGGDDDEPEDDPDDDDSGGGSGRSARTPTPGSRPRVSDTVVARDLATRAISKRVARRFTPEAGWQRILQAEVQHFPTMQRAVRQVFGTQKAMTLEAMEAAQVSRAYSRADWLDALIDGDDFARLFDTLVTPISLEVYERAGENVLAALELRPSLSFDETAAKHIRERGAELVSFTNATTKRALRRTLARGLEEGESFEDLAKRVRRVFNQASRSRARTIARTEVGYATSRGQLAGYHESEIVTLKRWNSALDRRVRDTHEIDGQTVQVGESFTLGDGEQAQAPRVAADGGRLSAHNAINCRCFTTPVLEGV